MGRTEDVAKRIQAEKAKKNQDKAEEIDDFYTEGQTATVLPGESVLDAVLREGKVIAEKRAEEVGEAIVLSAPFPTCQAGFAPATATVPMAALS